MKAVICREFSGPDRLEIGEAPEPVPAADEILIEVHAASVTYMDRLLVSGGYQMRPPTPFVPGTEAAGVVVGLGDKVTRFSASAIASLASAGSAAWVNAWSPRNGRPCACPTASRSRSAPTVIHSYDTAWYALADRAQLAKGETVAITGAGGGVGMAAVDVALHLGR